MRKSRSSNSGFSLTEVLLAVGTIAVGMLFIAGVFPVAIHFTTIASERTVAAVVADEAFAKIRLYGVIADVNIWPVPPAVACADFIDVANGVINLDEFSYPSDPNIDIFDKQFYWSALCRRVDFDPNSRLVQVTVFVSRKVGAGAVFPYRDPLAPPALITVANPVPVWLNVSQPPGLSLDSLLVGDVIPAPADSFDEVAFVNDGYTIVDNQTGQIYRVLERDAIMPDRIILDRRWQGGLTGAVWVVPPPIGGGRSPCIAVYQRVIRF